jgi:hypothetical protein
MEAVMTKIFLFLILLSLPLQGCHAQEARNEEKRMQGDEPYTWDFGRIKEGEIASHRFVLKNESDKEIRIKDITSSCGCTAYDITSKIIMPAEEASIGVKFNSKGYYGPVKQYVYVHTDNPDNPIIRLTIQVEVTK